MFYNVAIYVALTIFGVGLIYKLAGWFRFTIGIDATHMTISTRILTFLKGLAGVIFSGKLLKMIRVDRKSVV